jgi:signal transduction histidine kinase
MNLAVKFNETFSENFRGCADPVLICDAAGTVLWQNEACSSLKSGIKQLDDLFTRADRAKILETRDLLCHNTDLSHLFNFKLSFSSIACRLGSGEPSNDFLLIILKASDPNIQFPALQENNLNSVAHDLKNPLGAIFGYADALIDTELGHGLTPKHIDILSRIRSTAVRSIELVRNLQQLSNLSSDESTVSGKSADLNQIILSVFKGTWRENATKPLVNIELSLSPLATNVERILIDRVITNLYSNALKFTPPDGVINLKTYQNADYIIFEIANSRPLIEANEIDKIFDSRFRAKNSSGVPGTGLGLYIVKAIMQKISGEVSVSSSSERGTVFTVKFPQSILE